MSNSIIVAIDFPVTGRNEAGFADLAPLLDGELGVLETMPSLDIDTPGVSGAAYVDGWLTQLRETGLHVRGIASYCAGAAFVPALARGIREWQHDSPTVILFDPEIPVPLTLHTQFRRALQRFAPLLSDAERENIFATADRLYAEHPEDITALQAAISAVFRKTAHVGFERAGIDAKHGADLLIAFEAFARYLVAGAQVRAATPAERPADGPIAISSHTPTNGLNLVPEEQRSAFVAKEIRFDIAHAELLSSPEVAAAVDDLLR
jgi:hypothetical protein